MIIKSPAITIDAVDFADHVILADVQSPNSIVDDRTWGNPQASDVVVGAESVTLSMKWSDALMALLTTAGAETDLDLIITPIAAGGTVTATVKFAKLPFPKFGIGAKTECELVLAVVDEIDHTPAA